MLKFRTIKQNKILILGGYGGNNVGDDAQLEGALIDLRAAIPCATLVVLTPNLEQTARRHGISNVGYAPRVSFFDFDEDAARYTRFEKPQHKEWLLNRADHVLREAASYSKGQPHKLSKKQLALVDEIRTARLIYYAGGGYMMGPTASRLWDAMLVCRLGDLFSTPVVMSGQNIGVWVSDYDRECARAGFPSVALIGTRDDTFSRRDLAEIGVTGSHIMATHDDAFFVPASSKNKVAGILKDAGVGQSAFISLSLHLPRNDLEIVKAIRSVSDLPILIVPTCPPDVKTQAALYDKAQAAGVENVHIVRKVHSHNAVKRIFASAVACVSSRHHPIIFSMAHAVPCISLNFTDYFNAKNFGAMDLCGVSEFSVDVSKGENVGAVVEDKLRDLLGRKEALAETMRASRKGLKESKRRFMRETVKVWKSTKPKRIVLARLLGVFTRPG